MDFLEEGVVSDTMAQSVRKSRSFWMMFAVCVLAATILFLIPAYIIRPFRYQTPRALVWAITIRQHAPFGSALAACITFLMAWVLWSRAARAGKALIVLGALLATGSAIMSRLNYFEWMFHPVRQPNFAPAGSTKLDSGEMVLALSFNNDARAYPVREMAYHHIVNDVVGGVPVAVTY